MMTGSIRTIRTTSTLVLALVSLSAGQEPPMELGHRLLQTGNVRAALEFFRKAAEDDADLSDAVFYTGYCEHLLGNPGKAKSYYREVLKKDPAHPDAQHWLEVANESDRLKSFREALARSRWKRAANHLNDYIKREGSLRVVASYLRLHFGDWMSSSTVYTWLLETYLEREDLRRLGALAEAWRLDSSPSGLTALAWLGLFHLREGREEAARAIHEAVTRQGALKDSVVISGLPEELLEQFGGSLKVPEILSKPHTRMLQLTRA